MNFGWLRRITAVALCVCLCCCIALAELSLPQSLSGRDALANYLNKVNSLLTAAGEKQVNSVFLCGTDVASLGVTATDNAEIPEGVELTFFTYPTSLNSLELRATSPSQFLPVAAACIAAASPELMSWADALAAVKPYTSKVSASPDRSFADDVITDNGMTARTYFAYYPNQYHDGDNWLQMTLIFPIAGFEGIVLVTPQPQAPTEFEGEYEGIDVKDPYTHFEIFTSPTPEPNSPAGEQEIFK